MTSRSQQSFNFSMYQVVPNIDFQCTEGPRQRFSMHRGCPNKDFRCTGGSKQRFSMHRGVQTKIFDAPGGPKQWYSMYLPRVSNTDFRCTKGPKQRFSMYRGVPNKDFRCTGGPHMFLLMMFDAPGGVPKLPKIGSMSLGPRVNWKLVPQGSPYFPPHGPAISWPWHILIP